jgi:Uma2 family endonuclease
MSYEQWLAWTGASTQSEWVDGEAIEFMPASQLHQELLWFLVSLLGWYVRTLNLGKVHGPPFEMRLSERVAREPDVLFVARDHLDRLTAQRLLGPADLAVEIISDDSVTRDRIEKRDQYAAAGVPEYWLLDPRPGKKRAEFYRLTNDGIYEAVPPDADGRYHSSPVPGFWLRPAWLWQDPLPDPLTLLAEIAPEAVRRALVASGLTNGAGDHGG